MIYQGDYYSDHIYGTLNNNKVKVQTNADANFLCCELQAIFNGETWSHLFEIPFFNNEAEFYFENYIHSIITQKFTLPAVDIENYKFYHFGLASINMKLKEMQQHTVLSELEHDFYMTLGRFNPIGVDDLSNGLKYLLPTNQTPFLTENGLLSYSFLSSSLPNQLTINDGENESEIMLTSASNGGYLHTLIIPIKHIMSSVSTAYTLSLKFSNGFYFDLGQVHLLDEGIEHRTIAYQNSCGTLSFFELTGELTSYHQYKPNHFEYGIDNYASLNTTAIAINQTYSINTGYILDESKYEMLVTLLKSFNVFIWDEDWKKIVLSNSQKITPYKSDYYLNNEALKFKLSKHDAIHYRSF